MLKFIFLSCLLVAFSVSLRLTEGQNIPVRAFDLETIERRSHVTNTSTDDNGGCSCGGNMCGCCERIRADIKKIHVHFDHMLCANVSYLKKDIGVRLTLSIDGKIYIDDTVSAKDPPPICEGIPDLLKYGSVCIDFYNMEYSKSSLSGCLKLLVRVLKIKALDLKLGCFKIPLMGHNIKEIGQGTALLYRSEVAVSNAPQRRQNNSEMTTEEKIEFIRRLGLLSKADTNNGL